MKYDLLLQFNMPAPLLHVLSENRVRAARSGTRTLFSELTPLPHIGKEAGDGTGLPQSVIVRFPAPILIKNVRVGPELRCVYMFPFFSQPEPVLTLVRPLSTVMIAL